MIAWHYIFKIWISRKTFKTALKLNLVLNHSAPLLVVPFTKDHN